MSDTYIPHNALADSVLVGHVGSLHDFSSLSDVRLHVAILIPKSDIDTPMPRDEPFRTILPPTITKLAIDLDRRWNTIRFLRMTGYPSNWETERPYFPLLESLVIHRFVKADGQDLLGVDDSVLLELRRVGIAIYPSP